MSCSKETRKKISQSRKKWLRENPDKHPWKHKNKFKSKPCEHFKNILKNRGIQFIEEFEPRVGGRFFSLDIAMPEKMIAIEINGNQHYNKDGTLKTYYQKRHDILENAGWHVYEVHYSSCFNKDIINIFLDKISTSKRKVDFDYFTYIPRNKIKNHCVDCGKEILKTSKRCVSCHGKNMRKVRRPTKEQLEEEVWKFPLTKIGEKYGVSDTSVRKWCTRYDIRLPPIGYWLIKNGTA